MLNIGLPEFIVLAIVALLFVGPERLPEVARWIGRGMRRARLMLAELREELDGDHELDEVRRMSGELRSEIQGIAQEIRSVADPVRDAGAGLRQAGDDLRAEVRALSEAHAPPADHAPIDELDDDLETLAPLASPAAGPAEEQR